MMYSYLSLPLAIGLTLLNTTLNTNASLSGSLLTEQNIEPFPVKHYLAQKALVATSTSTTAQIKEVNYLGLMNAGYNAHQRQDYLTALNYFRQALTLQPGDLKAEKAIKTISSYGFDLSMQAGYAADRVRDYTNALNHFQKALQIRPDSWYAQEAVSNITGYLAQQPVESEEVENEASGLNLWFMIAAIAGISCFSLGLLFFLFKQTDKTPTEAELIVDEDTESPTLIAPEESDIEPDTIITNYQDKVEPKASEPTTIADRIPESSAKATPANTSLVSRHDSLAKLDLIPELIEDLTTSDRVIRRKAVWELAQRGDSRAMKPLVELMVEVDSQERGLILEAMTQIAGRTLKPMNKAIMMSLQDENSQVKQNAIRDLTRVYELMSQVTKRLTLAVEDSDAQVQETAKWALQKLNQMPNTHPWGVVENLSQNEFGNSNGSRKASNGSSKNVEQEYPLG